MVTNIRYDRIINNFMKVIDKYKEVILCTKNDVCVLTAINLVKNNTDITLNLEHKKSIISLINRLKTVICNNINSFSELDLKNDIDLLWCDIMISFVNNMDITENKLIKMWNVPIKA